MPDLTGKVAMITGAAGNLGQATARAFEAAGARLVLLHRSVERLQTIYADLADSTEHMLAGVDLTDEAAVRDTVAAAVERFSVVDVLVNTVGTFRGGKPVHEDDLETWRVLCEVNVNTTLYACRAVIPHMLENGNGKIVNVASRTALAGVAGLAAYSATKAAVLRLTESLSSELGKSGINVNAVLPSTIDTPQNREADPDADFSRWVPPDAIADVIVFLASEQARAVQGAEIPVYGRG